MPSINCLSELNILAKYRKSPSKNVGDMEPTGKCYNLTIDRSADVNHYHLYQYMVNFNPIDYNYIVR